MQFFNTVYFAVKQSRPLILKVNVLNDVQSHVLRQSFTAFSSLSSNDEDVISSIPEKPKKPLSTFFRYIQSTKPKIMESFPNIKTTEIVKVAAEMYKKLNEKDLLVLTQQYEADKKLYEEKVKQYNLMLTEEQRLALTAAKAVTKEKKERKLLKKLVKESNKPKRPPNAFLLYSSERRKEEGYTGDVKEWIKKISSEWKTLPEEEKKKYASKVEQLLKKYNIDIAKWKVSLKNTEYEQLVPKESNEKSPSTKSKSKVSENMNDSNITNGSMRVADLINEAVISDISGKEHNFYSNISSFSDKNLKTDSDSKSKNPYSINYMITKSRKNRNKFESLFDSFLSYKNAASVVLGVTFISIVIVFPFYYYFCL